MFNSRCKRCGRLVLKIGNVVAPHKCLESYYRIDTPNPEKKQEVHK